MERKGERIKMIGEMSGGGEGRILEKKREKPGCGPCRRFVKRSRICGERGDEWKREK